MPPTNPDRDADDRRRLLRLEAAGMLERILGVVTGRARRYPD